MQQSFPGAFSRPLLERTLCWARYVRQTSCPASFAEVGFELLPSTSLGVILTTTLKEKELLSYFPGVADGVLQILSDLPEVSGGGEIRWVHGIEHPVDSHRRAFARATEAALLFAFGEIPEGNGISGGIGRVTRRS